MAEESTLLEQVFATENRELRSLAARGLVPLPAVFMLLLIAITVLYLLASEAVKRVMFARLERAES